MNKLAFSIYTIVTALTIDGANTQLHSSCHRSMEKKAFSCFLFLFNILFKKKL